MKKTTKNPATKKVQAAQIKLKVTDKVWQTLPENPEEGFRKFTTSQLLNIADRLSKIEAKLEPPAPPAEKEDPWVPLKGGYAIGTDGVVRLIRDVSDNFSYMWVEGVLGAKYYCDFRKPSEAQVSAHLKAEEERKQAEVSELQEGDTCDATGEDIFAELHRMGLPLWTKNPVIWQCAAKPFWTGKTIDHINPDNLVKGYHLKLTVLPRKVFLHRAKGTAAKLAKEAKAKELALPIAFGTKIEYQGDKGWKIAADLPCGGQWLVTKTGTHKNEWLSRSSFTVIPD